MVPVQRILKCENGFTLLEIILSVVIMGIIIIAFLPLYATTANILNKTESSLTSTYIGKDAMELIYHLIDTGTNYDDIGPALEGKGYKYDDEDNVFIQELAGGKLVKINLEPEGNMVRVFTTVYQKSDQNEPGKKPVVNLEAQYEARYLKL